MMMDLARLFGSIDAETEIDLWLLFGVHLLFPDLFAASFCVVAASRLRVLLSPGLSRMAAVYSADSSRLGALYLQDLMCKVSKSKLCPFNLTMEGEIHRHRDGVFSALLELSAADDLHGLKSALEERGFQHRRFKLEMRSSLPCLSSLWQMTYKFLLELSAADSIQIFVHVLFFPPQTRRHQSQLIFVA
ncbi:hypothetical protein RHMOL_Rhmol05G0148000 [Rhododendron molle]|uniref:Uncharacterized protein n=1 Tax=Rhododendron molle TaxID=49168 RepID=A0ACC0NRH8_RHOML|nr:hypothetical protein RHMOL_Rhmol05G0148000 [Rhododendron molle]